MLAENLLVNCFTAFILCLFGNFKCTYDSLLQMPIVVAGLYLQNEIFNALKDLQKEC